MQTTVEGSGFRSGQIHAIEFRKSHARELCKVIKALMFREHGTFHATNSGVRILVDDSHCQQAIAYLEQAVFSSFILREEVSFRVPLQDLTEVLSMLEGDVTVKMTYDGFGEPLKVYMAATEDEYTVQANIHTLADEAVLEFAFDAKNVVAKAKTKADLLRDSMKQLDDSCRSLQLEMNRKGISLSSDGDMGCIKITFPSTSELIEMLECSASTVHRYRVLLIKRMIPTLNIATKVKMSVDHRGVLCCLFDIERPDEDEAFIEFYCVPDAEDEES